MSLLNNNFISSDGSPITGRVPTQLIVRSDDGRNAELTPALYSAVRRAYKQFCDTVRLSPFADGYHTKDVDFKDGAKARFESNNGVHRAWVWPVGEGAETALHGIGFAFTSVSGGLIPGWTLLSDEGEIPQSVVLTPEHDNAGSATGKWRVTKVKKLVGGQSLWVAKSRKRWYSTFWGPNYPGMFFARAVAGVGFTQYEPWVKASERITFDVNPNTLENEFRYGKYVMRLNDTVALQPSLGYSQVFINDGSMAYLTWVSTGEVRFYRAPKTNKPGLADKATPDVDDYLQASMLSIAPPAGQGFAFDCLSVHPDGQQAVARLTSLDKYVKLTIVEGNVEAQELSYDLSGEGEFSGTGFYAHNGDFVVAKQAEVGDRTLLNFPKVSVVTSTRVSTVTLVSIVFNRNEFNVVTSYDVETSGTITETGRSVLFYDHVLDLLVVYEDARVVNAEASWSAQFSGGTLYTPYYPSTRSVTLQVISKGALYQSYTIEVPTYTQRGMLYSIQGNWAISLNSTPQTLRTYCGVDFARDPVTLSLVLNIVYRGAAVGGDDISWALAVTDKNIVTVNSLLKDESGPIPDTTSLVKWQEASLHSLVSI